MYDACFRLFYVDLVSYACRLCMSIQENRVSLFVSLKCVIFLQISTVNSNFTGVSSVVTFIVLICWRKSVCAFHSKVGTSFKLFHVVSVRCIKFEETEKDENTIWRA